MSSLSLIAETLTLYRFVVIGLLAAAIHIATAWLLVSYSDLSPLYANACGFAVAFSISFAGQYLWTFRSTRHWLGAVWRFTVIAITAFSASNVLLLALLDATALGEADATAIAACIIPFISYLGNRLWALK
jgi:putative flippase GtrA